MISSNLQMNTTALNMIGSEEKLLVYKKIIDAQYKGIPLIAISIFVLLIASAVLILGALFLTIPQDFSHLISEVVLPLILPSVMAICFISLPAFLYGFRYHRKVRLEHNILAKSNYSQLQQYCESLKVQEVSDSNLISFIENNVLCKKYSRLFASTTLSQTIQIARKQGVKNLNNDNIIRVLEKAQQRLFMNEYQKAKLERKSE